MPGVNFIVWAIIKLLSLLKTHIDDEISSSEFRCVSILSDCGTFLVYQELKHEGCSFYWIFMREACLGSHGSLSFVPQPKLNYKNPPCNKIFTDLKKSCTKSCQVYMCSQILIHSPNFYRAINNLRSLALRLLIWYSVAIVVLNTKILFHILTFEVEWQYIWMICPIVCACVASECVTTENCRVVSENMSLSGRCRDYCAISEEIINNIKILLYWGNYNLCCRHS